MRKKKGWFLEKFIAEKYGAKALKKYQIQNPRLTNCSETINQSPPNSGTKLDLSSPEFEFDDLNQ